MSEAVEDAIRLMRDNGSVGPVVVFTDDQNVTRIMELRRYLEQAGAVGTKEYTGAARLQKADKLLASVRTALWQALGAAENEGFDECLRHFISQPEGEGTNG